MCVWKWRFWLIKGMWKDMVTGVLWRCVAWPGVVKDEMPWEEVLSGVGGGVAHST